MVDRVKKLERWLIRMSGLYIATVALFGGDVLTATLMCLLTGTLFGYVALYKMSPLLGSQTDEDNETGRVLGLQIASFVGFFAIAASLILIGFDGGTIAISTAVLWHIQIILLAELTKKGSNNGF